MCKFTTLLLLAGWLVLDTAATAGTLTPSSPRRLLHGRALDSRLRHLEVRSATTPSDDPDHYIVDTNFTYEPVLGPVQWVVPSQDLPAGLEVMPSNNNCAITYFDGRLFLAWRTAETHFASENALMHIISSPDDGQTWEWEWTIAMRADVREPNFLAMNGELHFTFFEAGTNPVAFEPSKYWRIIRRRKGHWTGFMPTGTPGEVPWDVKIRGGIAYKTSYIGPHYDVESFADLNVMFSWSDNGYDWFPVDPAYPFVYKGGVSEVAFEFAANGDLWAVTRNEDGDSTGFGSHVAYAPANDLGNWQFPAQSDPERYDSPKMFRHGDEIYLLARRDIGGPFDLGQTSLPFESQKLLNWAAYSLRPKRTALYRINKATRSVEHVFDLPSAGDTAFLSVHRTGADTFLVANYTSPPQYGDWTWIQGQIAPEGTQVYLVELEFVRQ